MNFHIMNQQGHSHFIAPIAVMIIIGSIGTYVMTKGNANSLPCARKSVSQGSADRCVYNAQILLNSADDYSGDKHLASDSQFGPKAKARVASFQKSHGLSASGAIDTQTWAVLCNHTPATTDAWQEAGCKSVMYVNSTN